MEEKRWRRRHSVLLSNEGRVIVHVLLCKAVRRACLHRRNLLAPNSRDYETQMAALEARLRGYISTRRETVFKSRLTISALVLRFPKLCMDTTSPRPRILRGCIVILPKGNFLIFSRFKRVAVISAKNHKRQSVSAKREKSQTPKVLTVILTLPNLT